MDIQENEKRKKLKCPCCEKEMALRVNYVISEVLIAAPRYISVSVHADLFDIEKSELIETVSNGFEY
jgi:hypothetical protein